MSLRLELSTAADAQVVKNFWPLYQHDVSPYANLSPNRAGIFTDDERWSTLTEFGETLAPWWNEPGVLFPYLLRRDDRPIGFNFVAARARLPEGIDADFAIHEFFVIRGERGTDAAEHAALAGIERHHGTWEIVTWPENAPAIGLWRRVAERVMPGGWREDEIDHPWGRRVRFRFENEGDRAHAPRGDRD